MCCHGNQDLKKPLIFGGEAAGTQEPENLFKKDSNSFYPFLHFLNKKTYPLLDHCQMFPSFCNLLVVGSQMLQVQEQNPDVHLSSSSWGNPRCSQARGYKILPATFGFTGTWKTFKRCWGGILIKCPNLHLVTHFNAEQQQLLQANINEQII